MKSADGRFEYRDINDRPVPSGTAVDQVHRFAFRCRSAGADPQKMCSVNLRGRGHDVDNRSWTWDGNVDAPTLKPSINCNRCWHGRILAGVYMTTANGREPNQ